ncbi:MAG: sigma-70 family RNA polymerase sigma factor [Bacteroidaceae bacterium]
MNLTNMSDSLLWEHLIKGDNQALEFIYTKYYKSLYHFGLRFGCDAASVEDAIQDLFVYLFNNRNLKPVEYVQAYLLRSLKNRLLVHYSKSSNHIPLDGFSFDIPVNDSLTEMLFHDDDDQLLLSKKLLKVLQGLSETQKQILYLRFIKELNFREIAEVLAINPQSAQNLIIRTLFKVRNMLDIKV